MKKLVFLIPLLCFVSSLYSQTSVNKKNNIYVELFGSGGAYSVNYERILFGNVSFRGGVMIGVSGDDKVTAFPILLNNRFYFGANYLEAGAGVTIFSIPFKSEGYFDFVAKGAIPTGVLAFCVQSNIGFNARIAFTPFYFDDEFVPYAGFSFGYGF